MSAFIVCKDHVDYLVAALLEWGVVKGRQADEAGRILWAENVRSVAHRYPGDAPDGLPGPAEPVRPEGYAFESVSLPVEPWQVLQAIDCLDYQSCETPEWGESDARELLRLLEEAAESRLPEAVRGKCWCRHLETGRNSDSRIDAGGMREDGAVPILGGSFEPGREHERRRCYPHRGAELAWEIRGVHS